jgi:hypothetical protein
MGRTAWFPLRKKELRGFLCILKSRRPLPGLNPRTTGPMVSTLTTTLPKTTVNQGKCPATYETGKPYCTYVPYNEHHNAAYDFRQTMNGSDMKMTVFWDTVPYSLVDTERSFRREYCLHQGDLPNTCQTRLHQILWARSETFNTKFKQWLTSKPYRPPH